MTQVKAGKHTFDLSQGRSPVDEKWRSHLVLVTAGAEKIVGLVIDLASCRSGGSFTVYAALSYEPAMLQSVPTDKGMRLQVTRPPLLLFYDTLGPATIHVTNPTMCLVLKAQSTTYPGQQWEHIFASYQNTFAPAKVLRPAPEELKSLIQGA